MRRPISRSKLRHAARCCPPLSLERLEDRLALSHAPPFAGEFSGPAPTNSYSAGTSATLPAVYGSAFYNSAFDGHSNQMAPMGGSGGDRFDYSSGQSPFHDFGFDTFSGRSAGFEPASQGRYSPESGGAPVSIGAPTPNRFGGSEQPGQFDPNFGAVYFATQITIAAPPGFVFKIVLTPSNVDHDIVVPNHVERPVDPPPEYAVRSDIAPVDPRGARTSSAIAPASLPAELSHASQPVSSISLGADSLIRPQAVSQVTPGSRAADLVPSPSAPQGSQPLATPGELGGNNGYGGLALSPSLDPHLQGELPAPDDSRTDPNLDQSGSNVQIAGETRGNVTAVASTGETESDDLVFLASGSTRGSLLATLPFNVTAVDQALAAMMAEVEGLGGEIVEWLEDSSVPPWAILATVVVTCGIGGWYYGYLRTSGSIREDSEEESSSWLFTQLENPAGQR